MQLYINTPGTVIRQKDECFRLKNEEKFCDISPLKIDSIILSNKALISTQAVALALTHNIDVIFLDAYGTPIGRVWFSKMGSTALIRRKQLEAAESPLGIQLVSEMVSQKLKNQVEFLKKLMHARPGKQEDFLNAVKTIEKAQTDLTQLQGDLDSLRNLIMGLEGTSGRAYFQCISKTMPEKYRFGGRSRMPAKDPFNAVLNYCYGILYSRVEKACILSGLDPFVGFLHTDNYNKKSMVFDFIEPFRVFAEQSAVYLFTGRKIKDEFFDTGPQSVSLNQVGKPVVVDAFTKHLEETVRYRRKNVKRKYILQHEAHRMANLLLEETVEKRSDWLDMQEF
jgi:CRISP-associated protein Cas1